MAVCGADRAIVVAVNEPSSLRDAQRAVSHLAGLASVQLVVNRVRPRLLRRQGATIDDAIDQAGLPLLGVVPEDDTLPLCLNRGQPPLPGESRLSAAAYRNIAKRIQGERVPLLRIR